MSDKYTRTHATGARVEDNLNTMTAGPRGPVLLQTEMSHEDDRYRNSIRFATQAHSPVIIRRIGVDRPARGGDIRAG